MLKLISKLVNKMYIIVSPTLMPARRRPFRGGRRSGGRSMKMRAYEMELRREAWTFSCVFFSQGCGMRKTRVKMDGRMGFSPQEAQKGLYVGPFLSR